MVSALVRAKVLGVQELSRDIETKGHDMFCAAR